MEQPAITTVAIFARYLADARAKLEKVARKAAKYGQTISWTERPFVEHAKRVRWDGEKIDVELHKVELVVTGDAPRVGDYRFLAALEQQPGGILIHAREEIGELGRKWDGRCDHCGSKRNRYYAFVVEGPDGERKIVGKTCLRDHLGMDVPGNMLHAFTFEDIEKLGADEELGGWGGCGRWEESTLGVIAATRAAIALWGWKPGSYQGRTTQMDVQLVYGRVEYQKGKELLAEERRMLKTELKERGQHYYDTAKAVLDWGRAMQPRGDYEHNLKVALAGEIVTSKTYGLVVSAAAAYDRQVAREDEYKAKREAEAARAAALPPSRHIGNKGDKLTAIVTIERKIGLPDYGFGPQVLIAMRADDGPVLSWKTGSVPRVGDQPVEVGSRFKATFTVKDHAEFRDVPETRVIRVKFEAVEEAAVA